MPEVEREKNESAAVSSPLQAFWKVSLKKIAISGHLLWEELKRLKIRRLDLARADLQLGDKAYATNTADGQAELVSRLDQVTRRVTQLRQQEAAVAATFAEKAKAFATRIAKGVQLGALQSKRRRILRQLGANLRQSEANSSLAEETQGARGVTDRLSSVETEIMQLRPQTYPWARQPLLLVCLLLLVAAIGGAFAIRNQARGLAQHGGAAGRSSLSEEQMKKLLAQQQNFQQQLLLMQGEAHRREAEQTQARIAAAERQYREQRDRERAEVEKRQRDEAAERDRIAAERARQEEKQREEESRIAAEKARQEQQAREADAQRENEQQKAAAIAEHATKQNAGEQLVKVKTAAGAGDREAMFNLGNRYMNGDGVAKDAAEAVRWYRRAADSGGTDAMVNLGIAYHKGEGVKKDLNEAFRWYRKAADGGDVDAMFRVGVGYYTGEGGTKDLAEAVRWVRKAAEAGHLEAMFDLGLSYYKGEGAAKDVNESSRWFRKAAEAGNAKAMFFLGILYYDGEGVTKDVAEAVRWYRKAADAGDADAMFNLGLACENGEGVPKDAGEAMEWYRKAAKAGDVDAMWRLVDQYATALEHKADALEKGTTDHGASENSGVIEKDGSHAVKLLRKAADEGDNRAAGFLSEFIRRSDLVSKRAKAAEQQFKAAQERDLQHLEELWDHCLILHDGRHILVGENPGEFLWWKSINDTSRVKLTGADREEAERLLRERQSRPGSTAAKTVAPPQPTPSSGAALAAANGYRNAKFITQAELLKRVGPVHLTVNEIGMRSRVHNLEDFVEQSATRHGLKLVPDATEFELVVNVNLSEDRIMTNQPTSYHYAGYILIYTIWTEIELRTKANCRRGDEFVRLNVSPIHDSYFVAGSMTDPMHFIDRYEEAFARALDTLFDRIGKATDADDKDDEAAWAASLWPPSQDANMGKKFLVPLRDESVKSKGVFYGISAVGLDPVHLTGTADKYISPQAIEQTWESELKTNGKRIDSSSTIRITHNVDTILKDDPGFYLNTSEVVLWQRGVAFNLNGELRRRTVYLWGATGTARAGPKQQKGPAEKAKEGIQLTTQMLAGRR